jgi:hypothetical protein
LIASPLSTTLLKPTRLPFHHKSNQSHYFTCCIYQKTNHQSLFLIEHFLHFSSFKITRLLLVLLVLSFNPFVTATTLTVYTRHAAVGSAAWTTLVNHCVEALLGRVAIGCDRQLAVCVVCVIWKWWVGKDTRVK